MAGAGVVTVGIIVGAAIGLVGVFHLLRSRCPHCGRFLAGELIKTQHSSGMEMTVNGYEFRAETVRHYRCRTCRKTFER